MPGTSDKVSLTVEGGISLVGPHCPGTVRLFCEGVDLTTFGWTYNGDKPIADRIEPDYQVTSSPVYPKNPAFVSVNITNASLDEKTSRANFSSTLVVDLLELNRQRVRNITCGELSETDTQQVDVSEYFTANITASYQSGNLSRVEVQLVGWYACEYSSSIIMTFGSSI